MLTEAILCLIAFFAISISWWYAVYHKYQKYLKIFSGPSCLPLIGSIHHLGNKHHFLPSISKLQQKHGNVISLMLGFSPRLLVTDVKFVEFILSSNTIINKSKEYSFFHSWLGMGLLTSSGMRWKQHRKLLTPAFHFQILEQFIEVFNTQSDILVKKLYQNSNRAFDIYQSIRLYALDVICEATMSASINAQLNPTSNYVKSVKEICRIILERILSIKMWDLAYVFSKDYYKEKQAIKILHALSNSIINNRREELLDQDLSNLADVVTWKSTKKVAFLDLLLKSTINGKSLPHKDIREEVDTFMFEGHDTTTSGLSFVLYCLSKHQDIQCKVFDEINEFVVDDAKLQLSYGNLQKLKYLEQVIKETLRMYPPVPMYSRVTTEDTSYQDVILPKGVTVTVSAYHLHHNPSVYSKPEVFDPERFNIDNSKNISVYSYIPFSAGPRNCIGQKFAMLEIKSTVCKILQQFKLLPVLEHEPILIANVILTSANGLPVYLETR